MDCLSCCLHSFPLVHQVGIIHNIFFLFSPQTWLPFVGSVESSHADDVETSRSSDGLFDAHVCIVIMFNFLVFLISSYPFFLHEIVSSTSCTYDHSILSYFLFPK